MALTQLGLGSTANDGTGDNLRAGGTTINANFTTIDRRMRVEIINPTVNDDVNASTPVEVGALWVNTANDTVHICVDNSDGAAIWYQMTGSTTGNIDGGDATG